MSDSFTEVTSESWFGRIGGAIKGVVVGLLLFVIAFPLLFWNEGRAVERYKTLKEGGGAVVPVSADAVDSANEGNLVHATAMADTDETLSDPVFGVSAKAIKLMRVAEMYQWKEKKDSKTEKKVGGGTKTVTTYDYNKEWSSKLISSSEFKKPEGHQNPASMPFDTKSFSAKAVSFGDYQLPSSLVDKMRTSTDLSAKALPAALQGKAKLSNGGFYVGADPSSPQVGDMRITFKVVSPAEVSVIAKQVKKTFEPYQTKAGGKIYLLQEGMHSAEAMIQKEQDDNKALTWGLRLAGFILMFIGLIMVFKPLSVLADVLPILGNIVGAGTALISLLVSATFSLTTVAIAWIVYRPLWGIGLIAVAVGAALAATGKLKSAKTE